MINSIYYFNIKSTWRNDPTNKDGASNSDQAAEKRTEINSGKFYTEAWARQHYLCSFELNSWQSAYVTQLTAMIRKS